MDLETAEQLVIVADQLVDLARKMRDDAVTLRDELLEQKYPAGMFEQMFGDVPPFPSVR